MVRIFFILLLTGIVYTASAKPTITPDDRKVLEAFWAYADARQLEDLPVEERIPVIARFFIDKPYKSNTLSVTKDELPVINLHELDCVTLIENVLALSLLDKYNSDSFDHFVENIIKLRYRNGEIVDYASRLHYSTDWLYEMERQQLLTDITCQAGGTKCMGQICYMSTHYDKYPPLKQDPKLLVKIKNIETAINQRTHYYIPKKEVSKAYDKIKDGDIILITTNIKGLDTSHLGFAHKQKGTIYLIHASSAGKKVMITQEPLQEYMEGINSQTGIIIARIAEKQENK